jgi:hypothetical protein
MSGKNIKTKIQDFIYEISSDKFKSAINVSKERGTDRRTHKLGQLYFDKYIGKPLMGGKIVDIGVSNPQQSNYRLVIIQIEFEFSKQASVVPDSLKYDFIHYDIDNDIFNINQEIERKDAVILSKIAKHINPETKYKETGKYFQIKGY